MFMLITQTLQIWRYDMSFLEKAISVHTNKPINYQVRDQISE